jgi:3-oxoacyl-[acyl-carrier protein] reductase
MPGAHVAATFHRTPPPHRDDPGVPEAGGVHEYAASKSAAASWTRSAAKCWAGQNITVNALVPAVETPGAQQLRDFLGPDLQPVIEQQLQLSIPLGGKLGDPVADVDGGLVMLGS